MPTFTWTVTAAAGTVTQDSPEITEANMDRFLDYVWNEFKQIDPETLEPLPRTPANEAQAVRDWMSHEWEELKFRVKRYERRQAAAAAEAAVTDLE